ncbi:MAG TPA: coproporphyrinogen III oxidase family protein [Thermoprotei archaeon]|nr:coproporphyrinogen III oxidase family protein [Thermoprotei archaeon]
MNILDREGFGLWSIVAKNAFKSIFKRVNYEELSKGVSSIPPEEEVAIYIHIPFCRGICLYCPYVRYPIGKDDKIVSKYIDSLIDEIRLYGELLKDLNLKIVDVHMGGGTPSILHGEDFRRILDALSEYLGAGNSIAIEGNPEDLSNEDHVYDLVDNGVDEVSLGVQSFNDKVLKRLGRRHDKDKSIKAIENLRDAGIKYLNIDMMYMIPSRNDETPQTVEEWSEDLDEASRYDVDEITCYPTLITNYSIGYNLVRKGRIIQPSKKVFKEMIYLTEDILPSKGFKPVEIYGYSKEGWKYVTVNYEMEGPLIGLGCGAMGFTGRFEYINTCSVSDYINSIKENRLPIAGSRYVDVKERIIRYINSRLFVCRKLNYKDFKDKFKEDFDKATKGIGFIKFLKFLRFIGSIKYDSSGIRLTRRGLFTAHQICWSFVLNVPCRMSEEYMKEAWPDKVVIP